MSNIADGLPKGWTWTTLGEIGEYVNGKAFKPSDWQESGRPIIRIQNLTRSTDTVNRFAGPIEPKYLVLDRDFLISWSATLGGFIYRGEEAVLNQHIFKVNTFIDKQFHFYLVNGFINDLKRQVHGSGMQHITKGKFDYSVVPLPPLSEQHRIVAKIEELFSDLDAGVAALQKVKAELKRYRQAVLKAAVEGKLTEEWRRHRPADYLSGSLRDESAGTLLERIRTERAKDGKAKTIPPIDKSGLPELPEDWEWARVEEVAEMCLGKMLDKLKNKGEYLPYLRNVNVRWGSFDLSDLSQMKFEEDEEQRYGLLPGDLVVCEGGEPGRAAVWTGAPGMKIQKALHRIRFVEYTVKPEFLLYCLQHAAQNGILEKYFTGTTIKHLTGVRLAEFVFPLPRFQDQQQIVSEIERRLSAADEVEKTVETGLKQAERLRQSILKRAFEGKLVPQDPSDPPASELLESMKKRKEMEEKPGKIGGKRVQNKREN